MCTVFIIISLFSKIVSSFWQMRIKIKNDNFLYNVKKILITSITIMQVLFQSQKPLINNEHKSFFALCQIIIIDFLRY